MAHADGNCSLQYNLIKLPYAILFWAAFATGGPSLGPIISGFSVPAEDWRWSLWEIIWLAGPVWLIIFFFLPETSAANILLRRARRLRALTGNDRVQSQSEIDQQNMTVNEVLFEALWRPFQLILLDPSIAFTAIYTALMYGIYYSFFEAFPLVYIEIYGFNYGQMGLAFLSIGVSLVIASAIYIAYLWYVIEPDMRKNGLGEPESRLRPAIPSAILCPIGLFLFAWTSRDGVHWIVSVIGITIFGGGVFILLQCIFIYLPLTYPQYSASLFAGNDLFRSALAAGTILFATPMYKNLGIGPGVSLLAGLTCVGVGGVVILYVFGKNLRARSRFTVK